MVGGLGYGGAPSSYGAFLKTCPLKTDARYGVPSIKNEAVQLKNKPQIKR